MHITYRRSMVLSLSSLSLDLLHFEERIGSPRGPRSPAVTCISVRFRHVAIADRGISGRSGDICSIHLRQCTPDTFLAYDWRALNGALCELHELKYLECAISVPCYLERYGRLKDEIKSRGLDVICQLGFEEESICTETAACLTNLDYAKAHHGLVDDLKPSR